MRSVFVISVFTVIIYRICKSTRARPSKAHDDWRIMLKLGIFPFLLAILYGVGFAHRMSDLGALRRFGRTCSPFTLLRGAGRWQRNLDDNVHFPHRHQPWSRHPARGAFIASLALILLNSSLFV